MTNSKTTRKALLSSVLALTVCVAMLIATTFAWFTDTASTSVNKIQAGTLDVALEMENANGEWVSAEGETLEFKKAAGGESQTVLWEPGCTYELPELRVVNKGKLDLKYKIVISGIQGSAKLNKAIEWTISDENLGADHSLAAGETSGVLTIKGHMKDDAGNEYQGLSIEGIAITVYATQLASEFDSSTNQYDAEAVYPAAAKITKAVASGTVSDVNTETKIYDANGAEDAVITATIPANTLSENDSVALTVERTALTADSVTYNIDFKVNSVTTTLNNPITVTANIGTGLKNVVVTHNGNAMDGEAGQDQSYSYDSSTGILTIVTKTFSPFKITYDTNFEASVDGIGYATFDEAVDAADGTKTVALAKDLTKSITVDKTLNLNLGGQTLTNTNGNHTITVSSGATLTVTGNGTVDNISHGKAAIYNSGGTVTLDGGTYERSKEAGKYEPYGNGNNSWYTICNIGGGQMTINAGVTVLNDGGYSSMIRNSDEKTEGTLTINGGTFNGGVNTVKNDENGTLTINGGSFSNTTQYVIMNWGSAEIGGGAFAANSTATATLFTSKYGATDENRGKMQISNGTFTAANSSQSLVRTAYDEENVGSATISGGTFTGNQIKYNDEGTLSITGGTFSANPSQYVAEDCKVAESGGTWTVVKKN